jgi:hypothetical protein
MISPLFPNQSVGKSVTVDIDVYFEYFIRRIEEIPLDEKPGILIGMIRDRFERLEKRLNTKLSADYRRSSNGHVHLRIYFNQEITVLDAFMIRAWMLDDRQRLALDEARYLITGSLHEMNRCFDEKATMDGTVKRAGPWIPLGHDKEQFTGDALADWQAYSKALSLDPHLLYLPSNKQQTVLKL